MPMKNQALSHIFVFQNVDKAINGIVVSNEMKMELKLYKYLSNLSHKQK